MGLQTEERPMIAFVLATVAMACAPVDPSLLPPAIEEPPPREESDLVLLEHLLVTGKRGPWKIHLVVHADGDWLRGAERGTLSDTQLDGLTRMLGNTSFEPVSMNRCEATVSMNWRLTSPALGGVNATWQAPCGHVAPPDVEALALWVDEQVSGADAFTE
jgi:hypothetical protein